MQFEVEQKFRVDDWSVTEQKLRLMGATFQEDIIQIDHYFAHPGRDFAATDEALRIRSAGAKNWVTYKGPKIDAASKTRREIELPLPDGQQAAATFSELLTALGFRSVTKLQKRRRAARLRWQGRACEIALDNVERLGLFVELDFVASGQGLSEAQEAILSLAHHLGLKHLERKSYLELLLEGTNVSRTR
jgi:adenylate cyclase class 2